MPTIFSNEEYRGISILHCFMNFKKYTEDYLLGDLIICAIGYFVFFNQLGHLPIKSWDESLYVTNVLEMAHNKIYLVKYFMGEPEMWATEPPLVAWIQLISAKLFGFNEIGYRLPSAFAGLFTTFLIIRFCHTEFKSRKLGYFSALVLMTTTGYVSYHVTRTADLDSLLVFFVFTYTIYFYKYLFYEKKRYFYITLICLIAAFFTKSVAGLIMLLPLFVFTLVSKRIHFIFKQKEIYIGIGIFITAILSYYLARESVNPGYIKAAWTNEIASRMLVCNEGHTGPFYFYLSILIDSQFSTWFTFFPISIFLLFRKSEFRNYAWFLTLIIVLNLFVISSAQTKIHWYTAQLFPYLAMITGFTFYQLYHFLSKEIAGKLYKQIFFLVFVFCVFYTPVKKTFETNFRYKIDDEEKHGKLLELVTEKLPQISSYTIYMHYFAPSAFYYGRYYTLEHDMNIKYALIWDTIPIKNQDTIAYTHPAVANKLDKSYWYRNIIEYDNLKLVIVDSAKTQNTRIK